MPRTLRHAIAAASLLAPIALAIAPAHAQRVLLAPQQATIQSIALNADRGLAPGSTLDLVVEATPRQYVEVSLGTSGITVPMREVSNGVYRGAYTVRAGDRIDPTGVMTARVGDGTRMNARAFAFPASFQSLAMGNAPAVAQGVHVQRFVMQTSGPVEPGRELRFRLQGAPGADAWLDIPGVITGIDLRETSPGIYEGSYTVRRRDSLEAFPRAVATLRSGNQQVRANLHNDNNTAALARPERGDRPGAAAAAAAAAAPGVVLAPGLAGAPPRAAAPPAAVPQAAAPRALPPQAAAPGPLALPPLPGGRLIVGLTSHTNGQLVSNDGNLVLEGRTAPNADVRVQIDSIAQAGPTNILDTVVRADANGQFSVPVTPSGFVLPGTRYEVRLIATYGNITAQERFTLHRRQG